MNIFLKLSFLISFALIGARIARKFQFPNVTGYLVGGLLLGPTLLGIITAQDSGVISFINELALSAIAFNIGGEFLLEHFKKLGKEIFLITLAQIFGTVLIVFVVMFFLLSQSFVFSIIVSAIAATTAPAGTLMVIQQYRAKGPLTGTILPVAALDDALGIMVFGIALAVAKITIGGSETISVMMFVTPLLEIFLSLALGLVLGFIISRLSDIAKTHDELLSLILFFVLVSTGISNMFHLSPLLSGMMMGAVYVNVHANPTRVFSKLNKFTPPINLLFFAVAGASLDLKILASIGVLGLFFVAARFIGKVFGTGFGAKIAKSDPNIVKYLGLALLPQGGVAIGLAMSLSQDLPQISAEVISLVLFSVLIFEIFGPILAKYAITQAGEIEPEQK